MLNNNCSRGRRGRGRRGRGRRGRGRRGRGRGGRGRGREDGQGEEGGVMRGRGRRGRGGRPNRTVSTAARGRLPPAASAARRLRPAPARGRLPPRLSLSICMSLSICNLKILTLEQRVGAIVVQAIVVHDYTVRSEGYTNVWLC